MKSRILTLLLLLTSVIASFAQGYTVYVTNKTNIRNAPNGDVVMQLPKSQECEAFVFNVVEVRNGWLKIDKTSFHLQGDGPKISLNDVEGECWVYSKICTVELERPGALPVAGTLFRTASLKSKKVGEVFPETILEICGDWVKVEAYVAKKTQDGYYDATKKKVIGWLYRPNFACGICGA